MPLTSVTCHADAAMSKQIVSKDGIAILLGCAKGSDIECVLPAIAALAFLRDPLTRIGA